MTLLEDLHWFDGASDAFLETIVESVPGTRDLLLVNFRPEYQARWMQRSYYQQLPLQPLGARGDPRSCCAICSATTRASRRWPRSIHARTGGNPFFTEEVVQSLVESGHLDGRARRLSAGDADRGAAGAGHACRRCWRRASIGCRSARSRCCRPPR